MGGITNRKVFSYLFSNGNFSVVYFQPLCFVLEHISFSSLLVPPHPQLLRLVFLNFKTVFSAFHAGFNLLS